MLVVLIFPMKSDVKEMHVKHGIAMTNLHKIVIKEHDRVDGGFKEHWRTKVMVIISSSRGNSWWVWVL